MKFIHLSDLHIGKYVNGYSMIEDQKYILSEILKICSNSQADAVIIAGDIYDKSIPSAEAVRLFDFFLSSLSQLDLKVFAISGNHDSAERIAFGSSLMQASNTYMSPVYNGKIEPVELEDEYGKINIYMLPFIKPIHVRNIFPDQESIENNYTKALNLVINNMNIDSNSRNIIVAHQFITGAATCESEDINVGGTDNVSAEIFKEFDYVALGHLHKPQQVGENIRYCGTPLKYSFSEVNNEKSITVLDIKEKGNIDISTIPLIPQTDMKEIKGKYDEIIRKDYYSRFNKDDYMHVILTDETDVPYVFDKLKVIYKKIMKLDYDNKRTRLNKENEVIDSIASKTPLELFEDFYVEETGDTINQNQKEYIHNILESIKEEEK